jgi:hypothetical protein
VEQKKRKKRKRKGAYGMFPLPFGISRMSLQQKKYDNAILGVLVG